MKRGTIALVVVLGLLVIAGGSCAVSYNRLNSLDHDVQAKWAQVENAYQRRADLIPNLVATVKGAANFERETLEAVVNARARATQVQVNASEVVNDPAKLQQFQEAQDQLGSALSRLLVTVERYPELKATQAFRDLQAQLEGTENRIAVERQRFNESAQMFNTKRNSFPTVVIASIFGGRFKEKAYFRAVAGSDRPPEVKF